MSNVQNGKVYAMAAPGIAPTVKNPRFMIRADGMVMTFNADVWNVDQRGKKQLRCVAALPASYVNRINDLKRRRLLQEAQRAAAANQFKLDEQKEKQAILDRAAAAHNTLQDIGDDNLVAEDLLNEQVDFRDGNDTFYLSTASKADMQAYIRDELHLSDWDWTQPEGEMRVALAEMLGVELPPEMQVQAPEPAPVAAAPRPRPVAAAPGAEPVQARPRPRQTVAALE